MLPRAGDSQRSEVAGSYAYSICSTAGARRCADDWNGLACPPWTSGLGLSDREAKHFSSYDFKHSGGSHLADTPGVSLAEISALSGVWARRTALS